MTQHDSCTTRKFRVELTAARAHLPEEYRNCVDTLTSEQVRTHHDKVKTKLITLLAGDHNKVEHGLAGDLMKDLSRYALSTLAGMARHGLSQDLLRKYGNAATRPPTPVTRRTS